MSVVGIDFGNRSIVVAVAQKGGIDVVDNEASNRSTPAFVSFTEKGRSIGESGFTNFMRNTRNTAIEVKRLLGKTTRDSDLEPELARVTTPVTKKDDGTITMRVNLLNEQREFTPEQVAAMMLSKAAELTEPVTKAKARDVVISVPGFWTDAQRRAMLDAANIAGLHPLRLLHEHTAVALAYGIYKTDLPEKDPRRVMFVDMGHSATWATVVAFVKGGLKVLSAAYDSQLGGRDIDEAVARSLLPDIQKKCGGDPRTNPRQWYRLLFSIEKQIKRVISAGTPKAVMTIDNLMNDRDYNVSMTRDEFLAIAMPILQRAAGPVRQALADSGVASADLYAVEVHGGAMRLTAAQEIVAAAAGKEGVSKTINMEEGVARGCALMCAMLSPVFRVREFKVEDITPYQIRLAWRTVGEGAMEDEDSATIIPRNHALPAPKAVTFQRSNPIEFVARYEAPETVPGCTPQSQTIGTYTIDTIPPTQTPGGVPKLKVKAKLSADGVFAVEEAETFEVIEETVEVEDAPTPAAPATPAAAATSPAPATSTSPAASASPAPASASPAPADAKTPTPTPAEAKPAEEAAKAASPAPAPAAEGEKKKTHTEVRKSTIRKDAKVRQRPASGLSAEAVKKFADQEAKMQAADRLSVETSEAKYALESYEYTMRDRISGELAQYASKHEASMLSSALDTERRWLEEEGENQTKEVYQNRLKDLQAIGEPAMRRKAEANARPAAIRELESAAKVFSEFLTSSDPKYAHIEDAEREKVRNAINTTLQWLSQQKTRQEATPLSSDPVLTAAQISARTTELRAQCNPIMNKPKPAPKPAEPEKPKEDPKATPPPVPETNPGQQSSTPPPQNAAPQTQTPPPASPPKPTDMDI